jgi:hypothetical protein
LGEDLPDWDGGHERLVLSDTAIGKIATTWFLGGAWGATSRSLRFAVTPDQPADIHLASRKEVNFADLRRPLPIEATRSTKALT